MRTLKIDNSVFVAKTIITADLGVRSMLLPTSSLGKYQFLMHFVDCLDESTEQYVYPSAFYRMMIAALRRVRPEHHQVSMECFAAMLKDMHRSFPVFAVEVKKFCDILKDPAEVTAFVEGEFRAVTQPVH